MPSSSLDLELLRRALPLAEEAARAAGALLLEEFHRAGGPRGLLQDIQVSLLLIALLGFKILNF